MNTSSEEYSGYGYPDWEAFGLNISYGGLDYQNPKLMNVSLIVIYIFIFITGFPTNLMAIWVFLFRTKKKHPASILMTSLALTDLFFVIWLPMKIDYHFKNFKWIFGETLCKVLVGFFYSNMYSSTIFIAIISVQRYWAVVHPLSKTFNNRVAGCVSVLVWVMVWLFNIPLYMYDQTVTITTFNITICFDVILTKSHIPAAYFLTMSIVGFVVPCIVCVVAYLLMFYHLKNSTIDSSGKENKKKAIRLMIVVLVLFLVTFTPSNILLIMFQMSLIPGIEYKAFNAYIFALCLSSLNSCIDPFVYYFISKEFRDHVKNMLMCRSERTAKRMKISDYKEQ